MPFSPFHLGPGAVFKAIGGKHFSFMVFGGSQVMMDIEPLIGIIRGWEVLHGYSHTIAGAFVIGTVAGIIGKPISEYVLNFLKIPHYPFTWLASFCAAYIGTFSHIILDAFMHADMRPWWPLDSSNVLLSRISIDQLHLLCFASGVLASLILGIIAYKKGRV